MKNILLLISALALFSFTKTSPDTTALDKLIDDWHLAADKGEFDNYFNATTDDFVFLGTDPTERWTKEEFKAFCKPYFEDGDGWDFKKIDRHWMFSKDGKTAWFDENLDTWMKDCRGSGICVKEGKKWKIAYYNLTVLIENDKVKEFIRLREKVGESEK